MIELNYRDSRPIYEQIKDSLRKMIVSKVLATNEKLPSVRTLAMEMSINPNTIQRAINALEAEGFIYTIPGKGSFVSPIDDSNAKRIDELKQKVKEMGKELRYLGVSKEELIKLVGGEND